MLYSNATKYLHIFKDEKNSYLPGVWYLNTTYAVPCNRLLVHFMMDKDAIALFTIAS